MVVHMEKIRAVATTIQEFFSRFFSRQRMEILENLKS